MADDDKVRLRGGLGSLGDAAELLLSGRTRIRESPVEHAKAATDATRALAEARLRLAADAYAPVRAAVLAVARRDWPAAAELAEQLPGLAATHPDTVEPVGEAVARAVQADRTLARQLAKTLPRCAARIDTRGPRLRVVSAMADLFRRHPGLGLAALPALDALLDDGDSAALASFIEEALGIASRNEGAARSFLLRESRHGQEAWEMRRPGLALTDVGRALSLYAEAHVSGVAIRSLADVPADIPLESGTVAVTDGRSVFLAPRLDRFDAEDDNFRLYKVALAHELGRIEFGTFALDPAGIPGLDPESVHGDIEPHADPIGAFARRFPETAFARRLLLLADDCRVDACLRREYPGLARDLDAIGDAELERRPDPDALAPREQLIELALRRVLYFDEVPSGPAFLRVREAALLLDALRHPGARVRDAAAAAATLYRLFGGEGGPRPPSADGPSGAVLEPAPGGEGAGGPEDGFDLRIRLPGEPQGPSGWGGVDGEGDHADGAPGPGARGGIVPDVDAARDRALAERAERIQRALDHRGVPASLREIIAALRTDPELSDDALQQSFADALREGLRRGLDDGQPSLVSANDQPDPSASLHRYPEWDEAIGDYRPRWTTVWERNASGSASVFVDAVLDEHGALVRRLRREFQALRPDALQRERRTQDGEELELDGLTEEIADRRAGRVGDGRVHQRRVRRRRDVAVAFLVDLSASTREHLPGSSRSVIEVEKEALVVIAESLEKLGDRYAIFGFSGRGRQLVAFDVYKDFSDRWDEAARGRVGAMTFRMENRDGAAIRHATRRLLDVDARTRLLVLLSDGRPLDCGCDLYQGPYAHADTRVALREALDARVHPFCITVDPAGADYLSELYGPVRYTVIDSVLALPERLPAIYRRLTSR